MEFDQSIMTSPIINRFRLNIIQQYSEPVLFLSPVPVLVQIKKNAVTGL